MKCILNDYWAYIENRKKEVEALITSICKTNTRTISDDRILLCLGCQLKDYIECYASKYPEESQQRELGRLRDRLVIYVREMKVIDKLLLLSVGKTGLYKDSTGFKNPVSGGFNE